MTQSDSLRLKISFSFCSCLREISEFSGLPFKYKTKPDQYQDLGPGCLVLRSSFSDFRAFCRRSSTKKATINKPRGMMITNRFKNFCGSSIGSPFDGDPTIHKLPPNQRNPVYYLVFTIIASAVPFVCDFRSNYGSLIPSASDESLTEPLLPCNASDNF